MQYTLFRIYAKIDLISIQFISSSNLVVRVLVTFSPWPRWGPHWLGCHWDPFPDLAKLRSPVSVTSPVWKQRVKWKFEKSICKKLKFRSKLTFVNFMCSLSSNRSNNSRLGLHHICCISAFISSHLLPASPRHKRSFARSFHEAMRCFHPVSTDCPSFRLPWHAKCCVISCRCCLSTMCCVSPTALYFLIWNAKCRAEMMMEWFQDQDQKNHKSSHIHWCFISHHKMFQPIQTEMTRCALKRAILHAMISVVSVWVFSLFVPSDWHCWICGDTTWFGQDVARKATRSAQSWRLKPLRSEVQAEESKSCFPKNTIKVENGPNPTNVDSEAWVRM